MSKTVKKRTIPQRIAKEKTTKPEGDNFVKTKQYCQEGKYSERRKDETTNKEIQ